MRRGSAGGSGKEGDWVGGSCEGADGFVPSSGKSGLRQI